MGVGILIFVLVFLACGLGAYFVYIVFCNFVFDLIIDPLTVPGYFTRDEMARRERRMTFVLFFSLPLFWFGAGIVFCANVYWFFKHFWSTSGSRNRYWLPIIPKIALSEILAMVFSVAFLPIFIRVVLRWYEIEKNSVPASDQEMNTSVLVIAAVTGASYIPLSFASAFHRLDGNRVPVGRVRLLFLFLYPYMIAALHPGLIGLFVVPLNLLMFLSQGGFAWTNRVAFCLVAWAILGAGGYLAWKAKHEAIAAAAAAPAAAKSGDQ